MITKYVTGSYSFRADLIEPVEIERETKKCVWVKGRRSSKKSGSEVYHDTWYDAHNYLFSKAQRKLDRASRGLQFATANVEKIKNLTPKKTEK